MTVKDEQKITELQLQIGELQKGVEIIDEQVYHLEDQIDSKKRELKELTRQKMLEDMQDIQKYIEQLEQKPNMRWDGFDIIFSKEEVAKILRFQAETDNKYGGAIGGTYKYVVIPTSIGVIITITDGAREATIRGEGQKTQLSLFLFNHKREVGRWITRGGVC